MKVPPLLVANEPVRLRELPDATEFLGNPAYRSMWRPGWSDVYVPELMARLANDGGGTSITATRDDNRSAILSTSPTEIEGREFLTCVKGCGAESDAFARLPMTARHLMEWTDDSDVRAALASVDPSLGGAITSERWFGNAPYGGQAPDNAVLALLASLRAGGIQIHGFHICPVVALLRLPARYEALASKFVRYRRYRGPFHQEIRLMPSNLRIYFHSPVTLGADPALALRLLGIDDSEAEERFLQNLLGSGVAALTLFARSLSYDERHGRYRGLDYVDVWLDKDAVVARDGVIYFADIEGLDEVTARDGDEVEERISHQFYRNLYEVWYAAEALASALDTKFSRNPDLKDRRRRIFDALLVGLQGDPYVRLEIERHGVYLNIRPEVDAEACSVRLEVVSDGL